MEIHKGGLPQEEEYTHLFEEFILISYLDKPTVSYSFEEKPVAPHIPLFCFPDKDKPTIKEGLKEFFVFVLTGGDGSKQYGFCLRALSPKSHNSDVPVCYTIISLKPWFDFFSHLLEIIWKEDHFSSDKGIPAFKRILKTLIIHPIPDPGGIYNIHTARDSLLQRNPLRRPIEEEDHLIMNEDAYMKILEALGPIKIILLFTAMLSERRIIFFGDSISKISACVHAAMSLLYPLSWQHIFVPILPPSLVDYCQAPMPFIVGVLSENMPIIKKMHLSEVVYVDIEKGRVNTPVADAALLPQQRVHLLRKTIQTALDKRKEESFKPTVVKHAFREFFLTMLGSYRRYFQGPFISVKFNRRNFIRGSSRTHRKFLRSLVKSQMFERWITAREEWASGKAPPPRGMFEREVDLIDTQTSSTKRERINPHWNRLTGVVTSQRERRLQRTRVRPKLIRTNSEENIRTTKTQREHRQVYSMRNEYTSGDTFLIDEREKGNSSSMYNQGSGSIRPLTGKREKNKRTRLVKRRVYKHPPFDMDIPFDKIHVAFNPDNIPFIFPTSSSSSSHDELTKGEQSKTVPISVPKPIIKRSSAIGSNEYIVTAIQSLLPQADSSFGDKSLVCSGAEEQSNIIFKEREQTQPPLRVHSVPSQLSNINLLGESNKDFNSSHSLHDPLTPQDSISSKFKTKNLSLLNLPVENILDDNDDNDNDETEEEEYDEFFDPRAMNSSSSTITNVSITASTNMKKMQPISMHIPTVEPLLVPQTIIMDKSHIDKSNSISTPCLFPQPKPLSTPLPMMAPTPISVSISLMDEGGNNATMDGQQFLVPEPIHFHQEEHTKNTSLSSKKNIDISLGDLVESKEYLKLNQQESLKTPSKGLPSIVYDGVEVFTSSSDSDSSSWYSDTDSSDDEGFVEIY